MVTTTLCYSGQPTQKGRFIQATFGPIDDAKLTLAPAFWITKTDILRPVTVKEDILLLQLWVYTSSTCSPAARFSRVLTRRSFSEVSPRRRYLGCDACAVLILVLPDFPAASFSRVFTCTCFSETSPRRRHICCYNCGFMRDLPDPLQQAFHECQLGSGFPRPRLEDDILGVTLLQSL